MITTLINSKFRRCTLFEGLLLTIMMLAGSGFVTTLYSQTVLSASPNPVNFGSVVVGQSKNLSIVFTNNGTVSLTIYNQTYTPSSPSFSFSTTPLDTIVLAAQKSYTLMMQFQPKTLGVFTDSVSVTWRISTTPYYYATLLRVPVSGTGIADSSCSCVLKGTATIIGDSVPPSGNLYTVQTSSSIPAGSIVILTPWLSAFGNAHVCSLVSPLGSYSFTVQMATPLDPGDSMKINYIIVKPQ